MLTFPIVPHAIISPKVGLRSDPVLSCLARFHVADAGTSEEANRNPAEAAIESDDTAADGLGAIAS